MKEKVASFLVPLLVAVILLYQVLASLQIAVLQSAALRIIAATLGIAMLVGLLAALGPMPVRVGVLAICTLLFIDVTFHLPRVFDSLRRETRRRFSRDEQRVADLHRIKSALDQYAARHGALPAPRQYGEAAGPPEFWKDWWDISSHDGDGDGKPFLDFLVEEEFLPVVPLDPSNQGAGSDPRGGRQYSYFVVPPGYDYLGGTCDAKPDRWQYMVAISDLEEDASRPPVTVGGSGCDCLWRDEPNFFQKQFDYVLCGSFDATQEQVARAAEGSAKRAAVALAAKDAVAMRAHLPKDQRRVADLMKIKHALDRYIAEVGPLPAPGQYGEAETSEPGFWQGQWDLSSEDGDKDGNLFLDFLVDQRILSAVPVDPDNEPAPDRGPRGGRQYVYYVTPETDYEGGACPAATGRWSYLLGITDLQSEVARPPAGIAGSGCDCLWRNKPNFFQQHFDYVVCGTFAPVPSPAPRAQTP